MVMTKSKSAKAVNFSIRMNSDLKAESEQLFYALGMNLTTAIQVFLRQSVIAGGMPFDVKIPNYNQETLEAIREAEEIGSDPTRRGLPLDEALAELKR